jgi:hypothetical protein
VKDFLEKGLDQIREVLGVKKREVDSLKIIDHSYEE